MCLTTKQHIVAGMSGGVDSAIAAYLLTQRDDVSVEGIFMQNWDDEDSDTCTAIEDFRDASAVCDKLGISLSSVNFSEQYWKKVFAGFLDEYNAGRTPNPDVLCNSEIKFRAFLDHAMSLGASKIATGHYARCDHDEQGHYRLLRGVDASKDQSYFLYLLDQSQLARACFPVGDLLKSDLRALAHELDLQVHNKKDSTGICFIGERKFQQFLSEYVAATPGPLLTESGERIGEHQGIAFYTIGQRKGLHIGGSAAFPGEPWYVIDKKNHDNTLIVGQGHDHPRLHKDTLTATQVHWIRKTIIADTRCTAKVRYRQQDVECTIKPQSSTDVIVEFKQTVRAITPGQSVVFYDGEECLGGGIIEHAA